MYEELDLNIDNYKLNDILNLFKLKSNFIEKDLKNAKKIVLQLHPDKSNMDKKYFLFFSKAYKILYQIYNFKNRIDDKNTEYYTEDKEDNTLLIEKFIKKENFNEWFNKEFEKINIKHNDNGYEEWLKSEENMDYRQTTRNNMNKDFEIKKNEIKAIIKKEEIKTVQETNGIDILGEENIENFSSDIFGNFRFEDLKRAHIESVIPISETDINKDNLFNNLNKLNEFRNNQNLTPLSLEQAKNYINNLHEKNNDYNINRAYNLALETEKNNQINQEWWNKLRLLK